MFRGRIEDFDTVHPFLTKERSQYSYKQRKKREAKLLKRIASKSPVPVPDSVPDSDSDSDDQDSDSDFDDSDSDEEESGFALVSKTSSNTSNRPRDNFVGIIGTGASHHNMVHGTPAVRLSDDVK
jgi:hypothetical protein